MPPLKELILGEIAENGPMPLSRYMTLCLQHPQYGYYTLQDPLGASGDFTTAPEISQMFGEMLGLWLAQVWREQGGGAVKLIELGPGRGSLMADVLRVGQAVSGFQEAAEVWLVETSPALRDRQKAALPDIKVNWADSLADVPSGPALILANEFFDALPVRQFERTERGWAERVIGLVDGALRFGRAPALGNARLDKLFAKSPVGSIVELRDTDAIVADIGLRIARTGAALIVDYGAWDGTGDTFQALEAHEMVDPLANPGGADLTAHVNFSHLALPGLRAQFDTQGRFLERLGITPRAQALAKGEAAELIAHQHRRLTHPDEMGTLFKVLALTSPDAPPTP
ncbi:MAG: SAM-dependent methyltransferase, partial [Pseudomonadota bacterium]